MVYVSLGRKKSATFFMILRKVYKKGRKCAIIASLSPLAYSSPVMRFTTLVNVIPVGTLSPLLLRYFTSFFLAQLSL